MPDFPARSARTSSSVSPVPTADIQTFIMGRAGTARGGNKHDGQEGRRDVPVLDMHQGGEAMMPRRHHIGATKDRALCGAKYQSQEPDGLPICKRCHRVEMRVGG